MCRRKKASQNKKNSSQGNGYEIKGINVQQAKDDVDEISNPLEKDESIYHSTGTHNLLYLSLIHI